MENLSIEEAKQQCIAAFEAHPEATWAWCCHHDQLVEPLVEGWRNRVEFIEDHKAPAEQETRFLNFRPVVSQLPEVLLNSWADFESARAEYEAARRAEYFDLRQFPETEIPRKAYETVVSLQEVQIRKHSEYLKQTETPEVQDLHNIDVPDNTWNGNSIFTY